MEATNTVMTNDFSPAGDPLSPVIPEKIAKMVKDGVERDEAKYWALDAKKAMDQTRRVLNVLAEIEGLDVPG